MSKGKRLKRHDDCEKQSKYPDTAWDDLSPLQRYTARSDCGCYVCNDELTKPVTTKQASLETILEETTDE